MNELTECDVNFVKYILVDKYNDSFTHTLIVWGERTCFNYRQFLPLVNLNTHVFIFMWNHRITKNDIHSIARNCFWNVKIVYVENITEVNIPENLYNNIILILK